jgi:1-aminocyclopropane-1-carboxylate deaminase/D-cysteine desulfhydrase-like pyridoxal-dependent ACC family enzyme
LGALGYVVAAQEILDDLSQQNLGINEIVVASGSGATHAGLLFGLRALGSDIPVVGICVRRSRELQSPRVLERCQEIADLLETDMPVTFEDVITTDDALAPGYGQLNPMTLEALRLVASTEGLILDPVYTGKVIAGLIHRIRDGVYADDDNVLFIHTGGHPALFAYEPEITKALDNDA